MIASVIAIQIRLRFCRMNHTKWTFFPPGEYSFFVVHHFGWTVVVAAEVAHLNTAQHRVNMLFFLHVLTQPRIGKQHLKRLQLISAPLLSVVKHIPAGGNSFDSVFRKRGRPSACADQSEDDELPIEKLRILSATVDHGIGLNTLHEDTLPSAASELQAYENVTAASDFIGPGQQEMLHDLGIEPCELQKECCPKPRAARGRFAKSMSCVFCSFPVDSMQGYGSFECGHKYHWETQFKEWLSNEATKRCKHGTKCPKSRPSMRCPQCKQQLGVGYFETGCYCSETLRATDLHADELEEKLCSNGGLCLQCSTPHPGFCNICNMLFSLTDEGLPPTKVFLPCCLTYCHQNCWYEPEPNQTCPRSCGSPWKGVQDIDYIPACHVIEPAQQRQIAKARGCFGGRPVRPEQRTRPSSALSGMFSQSTLDSVLMPPPSLAPRRSQRESRSTSRFSSEMWSPQHAVFEPITNQCATPHSKHFGVGCGACSAKHLPVYYDSLAEPCTCPFCGALCLHSEGTGPTAFSKCCAKGRVDLLVRFNDLQNRPGELMALLYNHDTGIVRMRDALFKNALAYNSHLSFGQIQLQLSTDKRAYDKRIIKCNNMMQFAVWDFNPPSSTLPALHGQLFTIPPADAQTRLSEISTDHNLSPELMEFLFDVLRRYHPYAALYQTAAEMFRQLPQQEQVNLRMLLVDSTPHGEERVFSDDVVRPAPIIAPADLQNVQQIHPGRLGVQTVDGSRLVAQFYLDDGSNVVPSNPYDVVLTGRFGSGKIHMKWSNRNIDPVLFPLLFSRGQCGFALRLREGEHVDSHLLLRDAQQNIVPETDELGEEAEFLGPTNERVYNRRDKVSFAQWFRYMSQIRGANWRNPHWLWDWGTIAQLYTLTFNNRAEAQKVQYMKRKQGQRRLVLPNSLINWLEALRNKQGIDKTISQQTYRSLRLARPHWQFYQREYANCMTICREFGPPDLLVTFTMSPDCPELQAMLGMREENNSSGLTAQILCAGSSWTNSKNFTKTSPNAAFSVLFVLEVEVVLNPYSGLPHVHTAIILDWDRMRNMGKIQTPADYIDEYICAEIPPNPTGRTKEAAQQRALHKTITTKNIHTCSTKHCLQDGKCRKHFPKPFEYDNMHSENAYPRYKRRPPPPSIQEAQQNPELYGREIQYKDQRGKTIRKDNSHVVAFSPFLSSKYVAHINVEFVAGDGCIKYLCKYMMKGADMAFVQVTDGNTGQSALNYDEIHQIRLARYISSMEAYLQQLGTPLIRRSHQVDELDVHGPQGHRIAVQQGFEDEEEQRNAFCEAAQAEEERRNAGEERVTQLTAYFAFNEQCQDDALHLTYATAFKKLWYDAAKKEWKHALSNNKLGILRQYANCCSTSKTRPAGFTSERLTPPTEILVFVSRCAKAFISVNSVTFFGKHDLLYCPKAASLSFVISSLTFLSSANCGAAQSSAKLKRSSQSAILLSSAGSKHSTFGSDVVVAAEVAHLNTAQHRVNMLFFLHVLTQPRIGKQHLKRLQLISAPLLSVVKHIPAGGNSFDSVFRKRGRPSACADQSEDDELPIEKLRILSATVDHGIGLNTLHEDTLPSAASELQAYENVTAASDFIGPGQQEMLHDLGIEPCVAKRMLSKTKSSAWSFCQVNVMRFLFLSC
uniref:Helitron helicase-like domain-containing protein n=2 Tax=Globodera rostochiensis TaxID=31243 RepID=A0A914H7H4_GLORO